MLIQVDPCFRRGSRRSLRSSFLFMTLSAVIVFTLVSPRSLVAQRLAVARLGVVKPLGGLGDSPREASRAAPERSMVFVAQERSASSSTSWILAGAATGAVAGAVIGHNKDTNGSSANPDSSLSGASKDLNTFVGFLEGGLIGAAAGYLAHRVLRD